MIQNHSDPGPQKTIGSALTTITLRVAQSIPGGAEYAFPAHHFSAYRLARWVGGFENTAPPKAGLEMMSR
jgi:hypothetical protein